jgi:hypothetical protein
VCSKPVRVVLRLATNEMEKLYPIYLMEINPALGSSKYNILIPAEHKLM